MRSLSELAGCNTSTPVSRAEAELEDFYEGSYRTSDGEKYGRWRQLGAITKADHVVRLASAIGLHAPSIVAEIGCGDGAVLDQLGARGFGRARIGFEISAAATALAAERAGVTEAHLFDGRSVPVPDDTYDLVIASHVLEHVATPGALLQEMARIGRRVIIEVPLEASLSARRPGARAASGNAGHVQCFSRSAVRGLVADAGLEIRAELRDPQPLAVHLFGRASLPAKLSSYVKWATRGAIARIPVAGERLITLHYAVAATPASAQCESPS
jgi:SAM-dependent methyltransferase